MYNERIENLIKAALADGELTEKEKQILFKNAQEQGIDLDEFEMVLEARLVELEKAKREAAPKSNKYGDVRKCPACGALVPAFKGICQECGFEFTNIDANLSSKQLADKLLKENDDKKKIEIIETFPIPTTKADLLEFLTSLKPRVLGEYNQYADAYFKKYQECIEKAKVAFEGDKQLQGFIDSCPELEKRFKSIRLKSRSENVIAWIWENKIVVIISAVVLIAVISFMINGIVSHFEEKRKTELVESFNVALEEDDLVKAYSSFEEYNKEYVTSYDEECIRGELGMKLINAYLAKNDIANAELIYSNIDRWGGRIEIYKWLINNEQFEKAWIYKTSYSNDNTIHDANNYYQYMSDVVHCLCQKNKKNDARAFVNKHSVWFKRNVDNSPAQWEKTREKNKMFYYSAAKKSLLEIINEY